MITSWVPQQVIDVRLVQNKSGRLLAREDVKPDPLITRISKPTHTMGWGDCRHREGKECRNCR